MDYRSCLENAFKPGLMVNTKFKLRQLFSRFYTYEDTKESEAKRGLYLHVMAGGNVETDFPYSARLLLASAAIVIRCRKGGVRISGSKKNWQITAGNLFICPCTDNLSKLFLQLRCILLFRPWRSSQHTILGCRLRRHYDYFIPSSILSFSSCSRM